MAILRGEELVIDLVNQAYYELVGQRELLGKPLLEALPELTNQGYAETLRQVLHTGVPYSVKGRRVDLVRNGQTVERRYVNFIAGPLVETNGTITGVFVHGVDVTEETVAQQRLRDQFNSVPVPLYAWQRALVDGKPDFVLLDYNNAARERARGQLPDFTGEG